MSVVYVLLPVATALAIAGVAAFIWAVGADSSMTSKPPPSACSTTTKRRRRFDSVDPASRAGSCTAGNRCKPSNRWSGAIFSVWHGLEREGATNRQALTTVPSRAEARVTSHPRSRQTRGSHGLPPSQLDSNGLRFWRQTVSHVTTCTAGSAQAPSVVHCCSGAASSSEPGTRQTRP